jgi:hypothetical protein
MVINRGICFSLSVPRLRHTIFNFINPTRNQLSSIKIINQFLVQASTADLAGAFGQRSQPQRVELDEARRITMIIGARTLLEGHEILIV